MGVSFQVIVSLCGAGILGGNGDRRLLKVCWGPRPQLSDAGDCAERGRSGSDQLPGGGAVEPCGASGVWEAGSRGTQTIPAVFAWLGCGAETHALTVECWLP